MIEGTLKYLGKRKSYIVRACGSFFVASFSLKHPLESFIHIPDRNDVDFTAFSGKLFEKLPLETKYYFGLFEDRGIIKPVYTFTWVHNYIVKGQVDTLGPFGVELEDIGGDYLHGHKVKSESHTTVKHRHMWFVDALFHYPEIYLNEYILSSGRVT